MQKLKKISLIIATIISLIDTNGILVNLHMLYVQFFLSFYTPPQDSGGFTMDIHTSVCHVATGPFLFLLLDDNLSNYQWISTQLGTYIDNVEIWYSIANGQIS